MSADRCQVLDDKSKTGHKREWARHKLTNSYIALAYDDIDTNKAKRMRDCASWLDFVRAEGDNLRLHNANFCRVRLCPICAWRRSLKTYSQMSDIMAIAKQQYAFLFVTLTMRNVDGEELSTALDKLSQAFNRLTKYKRMQFVKGYYRGCEVTHNLSDNTYHPHLHCVFAVNKSYFTDTKTYVKQSELTDLWAKALKVNYTPIVDVRKIKGNIDKAVAECSKYTCKASDIISFEDWQLTVDTVAVLDKALANRRFIGLGGVFKDIHKELHLDDIEDGDLIHSTEGEDEDDNLEHVLYVWHTGYSQYIQG